MRDKSFISTGRPLTQQSTEEILARMAANFPELIDPSCKRAKIMALEEGELLEWLKAELKPWIEEGLKKDAPGSRARVGRLLLDRARYGAPQSPYAKA